MKNCDEMVNSLLERRDQYTAEQKRKKKVLARTVTSICCVCLVALLGFGMWQGGMFATTPPVTVGDSLTPGEKDYISPDELNNTNSEQTQHNQSSQISTPSNNDSQVTDDPTNDSTTKRIFAINEITATINGALKYRDPALHYNEKWDMAKAVEYLGVDILDAVAALPNDLGLSFIGSGEFTVVHENNGTLVEDRMCYEFAGKDNAKITVLASKLRTPYDYLYSSDTDDITNIRIPETDEIIPVLVYALNKSESTDYALYVADFEYNEIYYRVRIENLRSYYLDSLIREIVK